jgi:hypothetical protein
MTALMIHELRASGRDQPAERLFGARQRGALAIESQEAKVAGQMNNSCPGITVGTGGGVATRSNSRH